MSRCQPITKQRRRVKQADKRRNAKDIKLKGELVDRKKEQWEERGEKDGSFVTEASGKGHDGVQGEGRSLGTRGDDREEDKDGNEVRARSGTGPSIGCARPPAS